LQARQAIAWIVPEQAPTAIDRRDFTDILEIEAQRTNTVLIHLRSRPDSFLTI
jgi:hypothetical protein